MKIALVRHGQTDWNIGRRYQGRLGLPLNAVGRQQGIESGERVREVGNRVGANWQWLAASDAERAVETAEIIGATLNLKLTDQDPDLVEKGFGVAEGMGIDAANERWPDRNFPDAETSEEVVERAVAAIDRLATAHEGQDGIIVSHGTVIRLLIKQFTGIDPGSLPNGTVAVVEGDPGQWKVIATASAEALYQQTDATLI